MKKANVVILEGAWERKHEAPMVLPYFHAFALSHGGVEVNHRTFRSADDIAYYIGHIPKNSRAFVYIASHGKKMQLQPQEGTDIVWEDLLAALAMAKPGAVDFIHFGCCEMVDPGNRAKSHQDILDATRARWASGYTKYVDWLDCMFFDLALVHNVFEPQFGLKDGRSAPLKKAISTFIRQYEQLARELGFSALSRVSSGHELFPARLRRE